jgi:hypothetical protein
MYVAVTSKPLVPSNEAGLHRTAIRVVFHTDKVIYCHLIKYITAFNKAYAELLTSKHY